MKLIKNNKGFSLIELMVVVAIIGIIMTIAIPNYTKFKNKAIQTGAKSELTGLYMAEQNFQLEHGSFYHILPVLGFIPDGIPQSGGCPNQSDPSKQSTRYYAVGFAPGSSVTAPGTAASIPSCANETFYKSTVDASYTPTNSSISASSFTAVANGQINSSTDMWQINESKVLIPVSSGGSLGGGGGSGT